MAATVVEHPLVQHKLTLMRQKSATTQEFRQLLEEVAMLMGYEVTRELPLLETEIETPVVRATAPLLEGKKVVIVSILRAGNGFLGGLLRLIPAARVGHIGLYRDPKTLIAHEYYFKVPDEMEERDVIVVDPMLATGHSATAAVDRIKETQPRSIKFLCLLAAPEGLAYFEEHHPEVPVWTASIDEGLNEKGYIVPGLGDAGDRMYGTK